MKPALKAEFKKLLNVRSTYVITLFVLILIGIISFYANGWRLKGGDLNNPSQLYNDILGALHLTIFGAVVAILQMTHEYRYNTIMHTLTSSNSRSRVLLAKIITISCYGLALSLLIGVLTPALTYLGVHAAGHQLVHQTIYYKELIWRGLFFGWAYAVTGLLLAALIRIQSGAIVALFVLPAFIEPLLGQLVNKSAGYLPFAALDQVIGDKTEHGTQLSPAKAALVFLIYLAVGWVITWYLFLRRDAA